YLAMVPRLHIDKKEGIYIGGLFYDGRADSLEQQVEGPSFAHNEMAMSDRTELVTKLRKLGYMDAFRKIYGDKALATVELGYRQLTELIAAYERSTELNPFTSKYDYYLTGKARLSKQERRGLMVFEDEKKGNCAACHPVDPQDDGTRPLFTDFSYDNLGVPANPNNPFLKLRGKINPKGRKFVDTGLGKTVAKKSEAGKFRVPTLRNVAITAPYMHNGVFKTLKEVVDFYNTRDVSKKWHKPEVADNVNKDELGDLKLTDQEVEDLVVFMKTLTDGYQPK
ncbi:MAG: c-type cytochrome, partial [Gammaproteobacteria bacterium]|nr:c-type cytochrome [Gammaproteobacteria bacterium]